MKKEDLLIGVHSSRPDDADANALIKAFESNGVKALTYNECVMKNLTPHLTIGYDSAGLPHWQKILNKGIINILWSTDSVFCQNLDIISQFASFPNFVLLYPTPCDTEPTGNFFKTLKHGYLPLGVDSSSVENKEVKKEYDIVFSGNIIDIDLKMKELEKNMPEYVFNLMGDIFTIAMENPALSFWQIYSLFAENLKLEQNLDQYLVLFSNLAPVITSHKYVQMLEQLKDFNVKVMGNDIWKKYIGAKTEYIGGHDAAVIAKSKIALHYHPIELSLGIHGRVLEAASLHTFVLSGNTKSIEYTLGDSAAYFECKDYKGLCDKAEYFLKHDFERKHKTQKAFDTVIKKDSLEARISEIIKLIK